MEIRLKIMDSRFLNFKMLENRKNLEPSPVISSKILHGFQDFSPENLENYGFSNDARGIFRAPSFEDAKFFVKGRKTEITVNLSR